MSPPTTRTALVFGGERSGLTTDELAARLGVKTATLRHWRMQGNGPRFIKTGRLVRYSLRSVIEWEESRTHHQTNKQWGYTGVTL